MRNLSRQQRRAMVACETRALPAALVDKLLRRYKVSGFHELTDEQAVTVDGSGENMSVLVFIASEYEDAGRITCGNAILASTWTECEYTVATGEEGDNG